MKANELMIGDWVNTPDGISRVMYIAKYSGIYTDNPHIGEKLYSPREINPIPLTPEILEKNGFYLNGIEDYNNPTLNIDYGKWAYANDDEFDVVGDGADIKYVHELQHALRLCGIEKEIEL